MRPIGPDRGRHLSNAKNAIIAIAVTVRQRHISPAAPLFQQSHRAAKVVRVRNLQASLRPIDLDRQMTVPLHIKTCMKTDDRSLLKLQQSIKMG